MYGVSTRTNRHPRGRSYSTAAQGSGLEPGKPRRRRRRSYQQVQKYERGHNRVSASSLFEISCSLDVGVSYFFDGLARGLGDANEAANPPALMASHEGRELAALFPMVTSAAVRRQIVDFVRVISQERP